MVFNRMIGVALAVAGVALAGCGSAGTTTRSAGATRSIATAPPAFAWLHPAPPPLDWRQARLPGTAALAYPAAWHRIDSDPGTVSAALVVARTGLITEFLNATPKQANETLQNWASFRPAHNAGEGDHHEQVLAAARDLRFRDGQGSCVIDRYRTFRAGYQEIACLVKAPAGETVIVAAGLSARWTRDAPALERAVSAFVA